MTSDLDDLPDFEPTPFADTEPFCARCCGPGPLFEANCNERPEQQGALGMYHCPDCGAMLLGGFGHFPLCKLCLDRKHPGFDLPYAENSGTIGDAS